MPHETSIFRQIEARHGTYFINTNDTYIGRSLAKYGEWSEAEISLFDQFITPGDTVVEAGANIGSHTVWLSGKVGDSGTVLAFEPARHNFQLLCANLIANQRLNVHARQEALGALRQVQNLPYHDPRQPFNFGATSFHGHQTGPSESVQVIRLDDLNLPRLDFLKADVEGFEIDLLQGATETIGRLRPVVHLEINSAAVRDGAMNFLRSLSYGCWYYVTPMFDDQNWRGDPEDIFHNYSFDMICLPNEKFICQGLPVAEPGDNHFVFSETQLVWLNHDWRAARVLSLSDPARRSG
jgi:FkbM family methyltransferase